MSVCWPNAVPRNAQTCPCRCDGLVLTHAQSSIPPPWQVKPDRTAKTWSQNNIFLQLFGSMRTFRHPASTTPLLGTRFFFCTPLDAIGGHAKVRSVAAHGPPKMYSKPARTVLPASNSTGAVEVSVARKRCELAGVQTLSQQVVHCLWVHRRHDPVDSRF